MRGELDIAREEEVFNFSHTSLLEVLERRFHHLGLGRLDAMNISVQVPRPRSCVGLMDLILYIMIVMIHDNVNKWVLLQRKAVLQVP